MSLSVLQLQTQAGYRSKPIPVNPLPTKKTTGSDDSLQTLSSSVGSSSPKTSLDIVRCSRCQRSMSLDSTMPAKAQGAVRFGMNSYYCARCANVVGFIK